jgi:hypothetical protein
MAQSTDQFVRSYIDSIGDERASIHRLVTEPPALDAAAMMEALVHPLLQQPEHQPIGIQLLADFMAPEGSIYFDAIYGAFHGQAAIRGWLLPTMASIDFIEFVPTAEPVLFDDGAGGTSLDEWQMVAVFGDERLPLGRGVSVRRVRDGWITWACDVYDTAPFRQPPPPDTDPGVDAAPLPDWPRTVWTRDPAEAEARAVEFDADTMAAKFHPTDSVYHDPMVGEVHGRDAIRTWLANELPKMGNVVFEPLGPRLDNGAVSVQEWQQIAELPGGERVFMTRGTSVRRMRDGQVIYAADYYDTASLADPDVRAAAAAAGATGG